MSLSRNLRLAAAAVLGLGAGAALWTRAGAIEPHLDLKLRRDMRSENFDVWTITITARGGETIDEIAIEPLSGPVHFVGPRVYSPLKSGWSYAFRAQVDDPGVGKGVVRITQAGRVARTYDVALEDKL